MSILITTLKALYFVHQVRKSYKKETRFTHMIDFINTLYLLKLFIALRFYDYLEFLSGIQRRFWSLQRNIAY